MEDSILYIIDRLQGQAVHVMKTHEKCGIHVAIHPHRNLIATLSDDGTMKIWKP